MDFSESVDLYHFELKYKTVQLPQYDDAGYHCPQSFLQYSVVVIYRKHTLSPNGVSFLSPGQEIFIGFPRAKLAATESR